MEKNNVFILQEVIDELVDTNQSLTSSLFKLKYFALLIKNNHLLSYVTKEIEGYSQDPDNIPEYRKTVSTIIANTKAIDEAVRTVEIPVSLLDDELREGLRYIILKEGVGVLEQMVVDLKTTSSDDGLIMKPLPIELVPYIQSVVEKIYRSNFKITVKSASLTGSKYMVTEVLNIVRSRLLNFCIEVGEEFGYNIKIESFKSKQAENNNFIYNIMKTEINNTGIGNIVNTGQDGNVTSKLF